MGQDIPSRVAGGEICDDCRERDAVQKSPRPQHSQGYVLHKHRERQPTQDTRELAASLRRVLGAASAEKQQSKLSLQESDELGDFQPSIRTRNSCQAGHFHQGESSCALRGF